MSRLSRKVLIGVAALGIGVIALQVFPIQLLAHDLGRYDQPVTNQISWNSADVERLVRQACYDCHSNETRYPFYASIAPISWLINSDVNEGRRALNFSTQSASQIDPEELAETVLEGEMPPAIYLPLHPEANLTADERQTLVQGFYASLSGRGERRTDEAHDEDGD
jgi:hypothetical protein